MPPSGREPLGGRRGPSIRDLLAPWSFPALIVAANLIVLHGFWLHPRLSTQHVDLLAHWLPRWCYLGRALAAGHLPTWLPYQLGGLPFASDPQSGWLSAPVIALFPFLSCGQALGLVIAVNPVIAGLGLYVFGRNEGLGRPAAAVGGLTLSLGIAASVVVLSMPFAAVLGWTAMALAGAAGFLRATNSGWVRRLLWLGLAEFSLAQVATAHLTDGLIIAGLALGLYVLTVGVSLARSGDRSARTSVVLAVGPLVAFPLFAAAVLLPRLALLPRTSIGQGYLELARAATHLSGTPTPPPLAGSGISAWWGTAFARGPAGYLGAAAILLAPVAFSDRRWRLPVIGFALSGSIGWLLNLDALVGWGSLRRVAIKSSLGQLWLRDPYRFRYLLLLAFAALAAYGTQGWLDRRKVRPGEALAGRLRWLAPGVVFFAVLPLLAGSPLAPYLPFAVGLALVVPVLALASAGRPMAAIALPVFVAGELAVAGLVVQASPARAEPSAESPSAVARNGTGRFGHAFAGLRRPDIAPSSYLAAGDIGRTLVGARNDGLRYLSFDPAVARTPRGFLDHQEPAGWPAYENGRSILFGVDEVQGYAAAQPVRYWRLVRRIDPVPILYNAATFQSAPPAVLRLFSVGWIISPSGAPPPPGATLAAREGAFLLYRLGNAEPRASAVFAWRMLVGDRALNAILQPGFHPGREAILEAKPRVDGTPVRTNGRGGQANVAYEEPSPEHVRLLVTTKGPTVVVVRNGFDKNWTALLDGRPAPVLRADYLMQAVAVPSGTHVVDLEYRDRAIGLGLGISAVAWSIWLAALIGFGIADLRGRGSGPAGPIVDDAAPDTEPRLASSSRTSEP